MRSTNHKKRNKKHLALRLLIGFFAFCCFAAVVGGKGDASSPSSTSAVSSFFATSAPSSVPASAPAASVSNATAEQVAASAKTPPSPTETPQATPAPAQSVPFSLADVPSYTGSPYTAVNGNQPYFQDSDLTSVSFESYSTLDALGRCGVACASVGQDLMPTEPRGSIGMIKPSGWHTIKYDFVDGKYLYNRCHLIGYQLTGENANEKNLITGTRYLNIEGMLPFENMVADYVKETSHHVLYRVTPIFDGNNLLASGVLMEAKSVEDNGAGIQYCVFCYNVEPGVTIDYATGDSALAEDSATPSPEAEAAPAPAPQSQGTEETQSQTYILNTHTMRFHLPTCSSVDDMSPSNRQEYTGNRDDLIVQGYTHCGRCHP